MPPVCRVPFTFPMTTPQTGTRTEPDAAPSFAVLTSGGDASGMNSAVRAVVRAGLSAGVDMYAIYEGYRGLVDGGPAIKRFGHAEVGGIMQKGGTAIGSSRSAAFRTRDGRRRAARNLLERGIDALIVIGGDGSLSGANVFREEWSGLLEELVEAGEVTAEVAARHPKLRLTGLVGSIDNDMFGTDMTIGTDTALHRITEALDSIRSTASSHQRCFVVEVMGRNCGYLALTSAVANAALRAYIPENPPGPDWADKLCAAITAGRRIGRRQEIILVAEGAHDREGNPITAADVKAQVDARLDDDVRVTILGHVQRGGAPSAYDRFMSTMLGHYAVRKLLEDDPEEEPQLIGVRGNQPHSSPLMGCVSKTHAVAERIRERDYDAAMKLRGSGFNASYSALVTMEQAEPRPTAPNRQRYRIGILHGGGPAPGMNAAVRSGVRLGLDKGYTMLAIRNGFRGLRDGDVHEMDWMSVSGWVAMGGAEIGTNRYVPDDDAIATIAKQVAMQRIDGLLMIGGWTGYQAAYALHAAAKKHKALDIPIACVPVTINNDVPASELSIGTDTALNSIVLDVDKIKQSAVASRRCFVVEVMGRDCGYLALVSGIATGAERIYLPEEGITLDDLTTDVRDLAKSFRAGKRLGLMIRSENADPVYTTNFIRSLFEKEGGELFDAREVILGHVQEGGDPSPYDRVGATRMTSRCVDFLAEQLEWGASASAMIGYQSGRMQLTDLASYPNLVHKDAQRPIDQRWMAHRELARVMDVS